MAELEPDAAAWPVFEVAASAVSYPLPYPEVCVPGAGWITFDPTNRAVGGST